MLTFFRRAAALLLLVLPAFAAVQAAVAFADRVSVPLQAWLDPLLARLNALPSLLAALLAGSYGLAAMLPFLFLYALPTAVVFGVLSQAYAQAGLLERLSAEVHPWTVRLGLEGKDLVTVLMGFGCNVPAIHQAKACHQCTREACISAIAFGAACSYQLPSTLAVLAAAGRSGLAPIYLACLVLSTAVFLRVFYGGTRSLALGLPPPRIVLPLQWPRAGALLRSAWEQAVDFVKDLATVFAAVCALAALAAWSGLLQALDHLAAPFMRLLGLPAGVAEAVVLSGVRKNGMAVALIAPGGGLKVPLSSASQVLGTLLLAGMLVPCIVTSLALWQTMGGKKTSGLVLRQMACVSFFVALLVWSGRLWGY
jgi:Fe2+ transport system protein B